MASDGVTGSALAQPTNSWKPWGGAITRSTLRAKKDGDSPNQRSACAPRVAATTVFDTPPGRR